MTTSEAEIEKRPVKSRALKECEPLIEAATRQIYDNNAFRITGLPVTASAKEISKHGEKLQVLHELGQAGVPTGAFAKASPPTADEIREALQRLKEPESRLIDEFFWFWPNDGSNGKSEPAMQALWQGDERRAIDLWTKQESAQDNGYAARHNLAVAYHLRAIELENNLLATSVTAEQQTNVEAGWREAFTRWETIATDEHLWGRVSERIRQLEDPRLTTGFGRRMRGSLPEALDKVNAEFALAYAESGKMTEAARHVKYMRQTHQGIDNVEKTSELVLAPARTRVVEQMTRAQERGEKDPKDGMAAARELLVSGRKTLALFELFFGENHSTRNELSDDIARICNRLPIAYHKATGNDRTCLEVLKAALPFATSIDLRQQIEENIRTLSGNLHHKQLEPIYQALKAIQDSTEKAKKRLERMRNELESMLKSNWSELLKYKEQKDQICDAFAVVLREISLAAWNNEKDKATAVAANNWALEYATGGELLARLNQDRQTLANLQPPPSESPIKTWVARGLFFLLVVWVIVIWQMAEKDSTTTPSSYTPDSSSHTAPTPSYSTPSSYGNTYRVPSTIASELRSEGAAIETDRAALTALSNQIEAEKSNLDYAERTLNQNSQYAVDAFNAKVHNYNFLLEDYKLKQAAFNARVDAYNEKLHRNTR
jgi:hypothetical protein